ncbi:MAG: hypothetical protein GVY24_04465, partial [Planctomycetes bacterium]|nr:hypothetical protein [Planctomycetota bacterium]
DFDPGTNSELNGMSVGGVGRGTDFHHVEILNNIDDGLEIFGGTLNVRNLAVWNIGDDSFDVDQGWRGKAQFLLIVQGAAGAADQGSGYGDNGFEMDGFDGNTAGQPVTAASIWNATVIGAKGVGASDSTDKLIALRDNVNVQFWNSIFMTDGEKAFNNDNDDGDGSTGFGHAGTLSFDDRWTTLASHYHDGDNFSNDGNFSDAALQEIYSSQTADANLLQISGSLWYDIRDFNLLDDANTNNALPAIAEDGNYGAGVGAENAELDNLVTGSLPIASLVRSSDPNFTVISTDGGINGDGIIQNITSIDPRASNQALGSVRALKYKAPLDGFFSPVDYRGAVGPESDWLQGWTAMSAMDNDDDSGKILASPTNPSAPGDVQLILTASATFTSVDGVTYELVAIDADGNEQIVGTVEGDGSTVSVADLLNGEVDSSLKYVIRIVG